MRRLAVVLLAVLLALMTALAAGQLGGEAAGSWSRVRFRQEQDHRRHFRLLLTQSSL